MTLDSGKKAENISIDILEEPKSIRNYFYTNLENKNLIITQYENILNNEQIISLCTRTIDNNYRILLVEDHDILSFPFIFKFKGKSIKILQEYYSKHIISSIIKTVLLDGYGELEKRISKAIFLLYHYWFFKLEEFSKIGHNVIIDIESIISIIINFSFTRYKNYTITNELIESLRERLNGEKLLNIKVK